MRRCCLLLVLWSIACADPDPVVITDPGTTRDMSSGTNNRNNEPRKTCSQDAQCGAGAYCDGGVCEEGMRPGGPPPIDPDDPNAPCRHKASCAIVEVPEQTFEQATQNLNIDCAPTPGLPTAQGTTYSFTFTLSDQARGFLVVPYVPTGVLYMLGVDTPAGTLDATGEYRHHNARLETAAFGGILDGGTFNAISMDWPLLVPYAPKFQEYVVPGGEYTVRVASGVSPCMYVLEQTVETPTKLDINFHFVGVEGLDAKNAPTNPDFQDVLERFESIYGKLGVEIAQVRYFDLEGDAGRQFQILRDQRDIYALTAYGVSPGPSLEENLSVDVFLVRSITLQGGAVLGISGGVPGAAGMHGSSSNGLVFSAADLGVQNDLLGHVMAHEMGHYLGLRHTTEILNGLGGPNEAEFERRFGLTDPIDDSPACASPFSQGSSCPDFTNLMFVSAPPPGFDFDPIITEGQKAALRANPLLR